MPCPFLHLSEQFFERKGIRHAGGLDEDDIQRMLCEEDERLHEIGGQATAKKLPVVELLKLNAVMSYKAAVDINLPHSLTMTPILFPCSTAT